jgi:hypothetical protein
VQQRFIGITIGLTVALFLGMVFFLEVGRRWGLRQLQKRGEAAWNGIGVVDSAIFGLLALLLGFSFSGSMARFDYRRELVLQEVNAISTAWQRVDILPSTSQPAIRAGFRRYLDALLASYVKNPGSPGAERVSAALSQAQGDIWARSVAACLDLDGEPAPLLVLPALNEMFDAVDKERLAWRVHPPVIVYAMLALSALVASLFAGYGMGKAPTRNWFFILGLAAMVSAVTYVIIEIEFPRVGLIKIDAIDQTLVELRATME